jgi:hypothetical protein
MSQTNLNTVIENAARTLGRRVVAMHTDRGLTVHSFLSDNEAAAGLANAREQDRQFAAGLLDSLRRYGSWTPGKRAWAHKLALEAMFAQVGGVVESRPVARREERHTMPAPAPRYNGDDTVPAERPRPAPRQEVVLEMAGIMRLFRTAIEATRGRANAKKPKITFSMEGNRTIVLSIAGAASKKPGTINVTNGKKYGEEGNVWFGRIDPQTGVFSQGRDCDAKVVEFLKAFSADPAGVAGRYGRRTGFCCFCHSPLTRSRGTGPRCRALYSVDVGYGPDCAKRFGLPFGLAAAAAVESERTVDAAVAEENEVESRLEEAASA